MKVSENTYLVQTDPGNQIKKNPKILRIIMSTEFTQIDFGYTAPWIYDKGGWIHISPNAFLQVKGSPKKYALKEARNIPLAPQKLDFKSIQDWQVFSLLFESIPLKECIIDIIEKENPAKTDFNFYNIKITDVTSTPVLKH